MKLKNLPRFKKIKQTVSRTKMKYPKLKAWGSRRNNTAGIVKGTPRKQSLGTWVTSWCYFMTVPWEYPLKPLTEDWWSPSALQYELSLPKAQTQTLAPKWKAPSDFRIKWKSKQSSGTVRHVSVWRRGHQAWWPEFDPYSLHDGRGELI